MVRRTGSIRASQRRRVSRKFRRGRGRGRSRSLVKRRGSTRRRNTSYRRSRVRRRTQRRTHKRRHKRTHIGGAGKGRVKYDFTGGSPYLHGISLAAMQVAYEKAVAKHGGDAVSRSREGTGPNNFFLLADMRKAAIAGVPPVITGGTAEDWQTCRLDVNHGPEELCKSINKSKAATEEAAKAAKAVFKEAHDGLSQEEHAELVRNVEEANAALFHAQQKQGGPADQAAAIAEEKAKAK